MEVKKGFPSCPLGGGGELPERVQPSGLAWSDLIWSGLAWSGLVGRSALVWSGLVWSDLVWSGQGRAVYSALQKTLSRHYKFRKYKMSQNKVLKAFEKSAEKI